MPLVVKAKVFLVSLGVLLAAIASGMSVFFHFGAIAAGVICLVWVWVLGWLVFVFWPKFDPTGTTVWRGSSASKRIALTFDDGPAAATGAVLDTLRKHQVKASFFFLGKNAAQFPALVARARAEGHDVGNHGYSHGKMHFWPRARVEQEILAGEAALGPPSQIGGKKILRVPHGFKSIALVRVARRLGYRLIGWTDGVWDSDCPGVETIIARTLAVARPGAILLLHDGAGSDPTGDRSQTALALDSILEKCQEAGFQFVSLSELFSE